MSAVPLRLVLLGDVMLGRGIDQILARPGDPELREEWVTDARDYVALAENAHGPIPRGVDPGYPWGDVLEVLAEQPGRVLVLNLETAVTRSRDFAPYKAVCFRMSPGNAAAVAVARPDACVLANNHVLDFGRSGLGETLDVLAAEGLPVVGAGRTEAEAHLPAVTSTAGGARVVVHALASPTSGVPPTWAAGSDVPGVSFIPALTPEHAETVVRRVSETRRPGDLVVVSVHWGSNWGYEILGEQVAFAHVLVDGGVDVVHGHSSHHPRPVEAYRGRLILCGCGDLVNDYEGIRGYDEFRGDLRLVYLASLGSDGSLLGLRMVPMRARRLRLERAPAEDVRWLAATLDRESRALRTRVRLDGGELRVSP